MLSSLAENLSRNKLQEELFKCVANGDLKGFMENLPEGKGPKGERLAPVDKNRRTTGMFTNVTGLFKKDIDLNAPNEDGYTLLHVASLRGHSELVEKLLEINVETLTKDNGGNTALHLAAWNGYTDIVRLLLKAGTNVNDVNLEGNTPLHFTAQYGKDNLVTLELLKNGANGLIRNRVFETPLDLAARYGRVAIAQELAKAEIVDQLYRRGDRPRSSPLHLAAGNGHADIVKMLLRAGVDINVLNFEGSTALHEATQYGKRAVVLLLLQNGASVTSTNDRQQTPLKLFQAFNGNAQSNPIPALLMAAEQGATAEKLQEIFTSASTATASGGAAGPQHSPSFSQSGAVPQTAALARAAAVAMPSTPSAATDVSPSSGRVVPATTAPTSLIRARAKLAYTGSAYDTSVLSFEVDDIIFIEKQNESGWWHGMHEKTGHRGDFKANYVEIIYDDEVTAAPAAMAVTPGLSSYGAGSFLPTAGTTTTASFTPGVATIVPANGGGNTSSPIPAPRPLSTYSNGSGNGMARSGSNTNLARSPSSTSINMSGGADMDIPLGTPPTGRKPLGGISYGIPTAAINTATLKPAGPTKQDEDAHQAPLPDDAKWIERWLYELKLEKYLPNFVDSGYDSRETVQEMGPGDLEMIDIKLPGHRKKFLLGIDKLRSMPPDVCASGSTGPVLSAAQPIDATAQSVPVAAPRRRSLVGTGLDEVPDSMATGSPVPVHKPVVPQSRPIVEVKTTSNNELESLLAQVESVSVAGLVSSPPLAAQPSKLQGKTLPPPPPAPASIPPPLSTTTNNRPVSSVGVSLPPPILASNVPKPAVPVPGAVKTTASAPPIAPVKHAMLDSLPPPTQRAPIVESTPPKTTPTPAPAPVAAKPAVPTVTKPAAPPVSIKPAAAPEPPANDDIMSQVDDMMASLEAQLNDLM